MQVQVLECSLKKGGHLSRVTGSLYWLTVQRIYLLKNMS